MKRALSLKAAGISKFPSQNIFIRWLALPLGRYGEQWLHACYTKLEMTAFKELLLRLSRFVFWTSCVALICNASALFQLVLWVTFSKSLLFKSLGRTVPSFIVSFDATSLANRIPSKVVFTWAYVRFWFRWQIWSALSRSCFTARRYINFEHVRTRARFSAPKHIY